MFCLSFLSDFLFLFINQNVTEITAADFIIIVTQMFPYSNVSLQNIPETKLPPHSTHFKPLINACTLIKITHWLFTFLVNSKLKSITNNIGK